MIRTPLRGTIYMQCGSRTWRLEEELGGAHLRPNQRSRQGVRPFCMCADCSNVLKVWLLVYAEVTWLLIIHINLLSAVGLGAILAPIPMLHLRSTLLGDISPSIPSKPVQATTWYTLSIVVPATRFTSERQVDAWDRFREHLRSTRQSNIDLPVGRHVASPEHASTDMLVSAIHSGFRDPQNRRLFEARMIFKHKTLHPGGLSTDFAFL